MLLHLPLKDCLGTTLRVLQSLESEFACRRLSGEIILLSQGMRGRDEILAQEAEQNIYTVNHSVLSPISSPIGPSPSVLSKKNLKYTRAMDCAKDHGCKNE